MSVKVSIYVRRCVRYLAPAVTALSFHLRKCLMLSSSAFRLRLSLYCYLFLYIHYTFFLYLFVSIYIRKFCSHFLILIFLIPITWRSFFGVKFSEYVCFFLLFFNTQINRNALGYSYFIWVSSRRSMVGVPNYFSYADFWTLKHVNYK